MLATTLGISPLLAAGTDEQRQRFLTPFLSASGAPLAAFAFSEPGGSANFEEPAPGAGLTSTAVRNGAGWRIDGAKNWISNAYGWDGNGPDVMTIVAAASLNDSASPDGIPAGEGVSGEMQAEDRKQLTAFAVPQATLGISFEAPINTVGLRTHLLPRVRFSGVNVRDEDRIGEVGNGARLVDAAFGGGAGVGALALGVGEAAFSFALAYARTEKRGGIFPIIDHQSVQFALTDAKIRLEAARSLVYRAAGAIDARSGHAMDLSLAAKIYASETVIEVITALMRVVGVESFSDITPLTLFLNEALAFPLIGGSNNGFRRRQFGRRLAAPRS
jgi:alkylation response protein AidB-like acyl-CoA dehydrogenase